MMSPFIAISHYAATMPSGVETAFLFVFIFVLLASRIILDRTWPEFTAFSLLFIRAFREKHSISFENTCSEQQKVVSA